MTKIEQLNGLIMMYSKKEPKYYHVDDENRKLYLNKEANKVLNEFNKIKKMISEVKKEKKN